MGKKRSKTDDVTLIDTLVGGIAHEKSISKKSLNYKINLKCKNQKQKELVKTIENNQITFVKGIFGVGKTFVINSVALNMLKDTENNIEKIILIVPTLENGGRELSIGLLPGSKMEKIESYHEATLDTMKKILTQSNNIKPKEIINNLIQEGLIEMECANFVLGKTWDNSFIIIDECENFNKQEMLLLCSRLGENSKMVFSGDMRQVTRQSIINKKEESGFLYAIRKLTSIEGIDKIEFDENDIVRNNLLYEIYKKWNEN